MSTDSRKAPAGGRQLVWIGVGLALIVILTIVLLAIREPASFEPDTPEAAVQGYLQAVLDGDELAATSFFSAGSDCTADDFDGRRDVTNVRITLLESETSEDTALVEVRVRFDEPGLGTISTFDTDERFTLLLETGAWKISGIPWPLSFCGRPP